MLTVGVWKNGYYVIDGKSNGAFAYGVGPDPTRKPPPSQEHPAVFMLRKMGETEPLIHIQTRSIRISKNGTPVDIDLMASRRPQSSRRVVRVEAWTENEGLNPNLNQPYSWRCRVSIPGGGLIERTEQFDFEAPEAGYRPFDEVGFTKTAQSWKKRFDKDYFARMPDGTYARFRFGFTSAGDHYFRIESYLNPVPGRRNLEFDPTKIVKAQ